MGIKMKRSAVAGKAPATTDLELGELAVNTRDGKLYLKKDNGTPSIVEVGPVTSVAGKTGTVTLAKGDVGLGNVDNTSDANKPISTATQTALAGKAPVDQITWAQGVSVGSGTDLNTVVANGHYRIQTGHSNLPVGGDFGQMIVCRGSDTILQILSGFTGPVWARNGNPTNIGGGGSWSAWKRLDGWEGASYTVSTSGPSGGTDGDFWFERSA